MKNILKLLTLASFFFLSNQALCQNQSSIEQYTYTHLNQGNLQTVLTFLQNLEKQGNTEGIYLLGMVYLEGYIGLKDARLANYYFNKASALGFAPATKTLADSFMAGDGVTKNETTAYYLYEKAALLGYGPAQFNAGIMLKNGQGVPVSNKKAYYFLDLAAHNSDLGEMQQDAAYYRDQLQG